MIHFCAFAGILLILLNYVLGIDIASRMWLSYSMTRTRTDYSGKALLAQIVRDSKRKGGK